MKTTQQLWASLFEAKKVDNEGDMAADQLFTIADAAEEIHDMLEDDTQLPSWVQSKIAKVAADLDSVRDYMIANFVDDDDMEDDEDEDDMEESYQGKGNHKPGWMLKADPKLGAKVKANIDLAKKRQASYGNKDAGKSVKEEVELDEAKLDKSNPIVKEYDAMKKLDIKTLRGMVRGQHRIVDTSELRTKDHAISTYLRAKHGNKKVDQAFGFSEETMAEAKDPSAKIAALEKKIDAKQGSLEMAREKRRMSGKSKGVQSQREVKLSAEISNLRQELHILKNKQGVAEETIHVGHRNSKGDWIKTSTHSNYADAKKAMADLEKQGKKGVQHRYDNNGNIDPGTHNFRKVDEQGVAEGSLEEISQDTARSYAQKAHASQKDLINQTYRKGADTDKLNKKIQNRQQGLNRAQTDKRYYKDEQGVAEEVKQIDELKKSTLGSYIKKANQSAMSIAHAVGSKGGAASDDHINKMFKRKAGVNKAVDRLTKEEVDITEKLSVSQGMGAWIDDFKQSDAPQFKGKSDKERRDMAIAAFMSAKRAQKESVQESTDKDYIEQKLADADINASVKGKVVMVDKEDLLKAKAIVKKLGYTHQVKAGLNA